MLPKRNLLESLSLISCSGTIICILLNYATSISPITGIWFPLYLISLFILTVSLSFKFINWILSVNKPFEYDFEEVFKEYPSLSFLSNHLPKVSKNINKIECKEYDTNELSVITTVLERKLVSSWYVPYISQEIGFPFACKQLLDQMVGKSFQICNKIDVKEVYVDFCSILISHLKEYKKALKRHEKSPDSTVESLYKMTHPTSNNKKNQTAEHCTNVIRVILKELMPWELWDAPYSELLVRVLSKRLDEFLDQTLSDPVWLNDKLMSILEQTPKNTTEVKKGNPVVDKEIPTKHTHNQNEMPLKEAKEEIKYEVEEPKPETMTIESALSTVTAKSTAPILQRVMNEEVEIGSAGNEKMESILEETPMQGTEAVDIKTSPVLRQRRGRQGRNEVKIYDRVIEGSVKTWESDIDLQCISLGQDLLASLDGEITLSRLWGQDAEADSSPNPPRGKSPQPLWFGEEHATDLDINSPKDSPKSPLKREFSPKPAEVLLKDLQSTVHQAKTKIGDLQVPVGYVDVPRKRSSGDEAAGMMEGLLDFGIAGLKKGLRFTGLSDDSQEKEKSPSHQKEKIGEQVSPPPESKSKLIELKDIVPSSVIQKDEDGVSTPPPLVKQNRVISQDSVASQPQAIPMVSAESPEPEYEEAADLSTSIAKLRSLLQQRENFRNEDIWWEGAEETRGRTQHHHSSRPVDTATLADEYDMNAERSSPNQSSNNMQRLLQRTVTGVFNSLRTAVGVDVTPPPQDKTWTFVTAAGDVGLGGAVARLVSSRRAFTHVETAMDSLHQLTSPVEDKEVVPEDFEDWLCSSLRTWQASADVASAAGLLTAATGTRVVAILMADLGETLITAWLEDLCTWLREQIFTVFRNVDASAASEGGEPRELRPFDLDVTCQAIVEKFPFPVTYIFGEDAVSSAVRLTVSSFSHAKVTRDVWSRAGDVLTTHFKRSADRRRPGIDQ